MQTRPSWCFLQDIRGVGFPVASQLPQMFHYLDDGHDHQNRNHDDHDRNHDDHDVMQNDYDEHDDNSS